MSPETISSVFPDRLIHPLPKRRLKERLSPDVAESIKYPPAHVTGTPLFYYPYNLKDEPTTVERTIVVGRAGMTASAAPATNPNSALTTASAGSAMDQSTTAAARARRDSEDEGPADPSRVVRLVSRSAHPPQLLNPSPESHQTVPSAASSVDGYESFENTNNKKKRKIPSAGDIPHSGSYTSTDLLSATSGSSSTNTHDESFGGSPSSTAYSGPASFISGSAGISGPGRGRYGRSRSGRPPLHPLSDAGSNWAGRYGKLRPPWPTQSDPEPVLTPGGQMGIISNAIANAEKQASRGQENTGLLHLQQPTTATPASAQFTFTCTSQVPGNLTWPGSDPKLSPSSSYWNQGRFRGGQNPDMSTVRDIDAGQHGGSTASSGASRSPRGTDGSRAKQPGRKKKARSKISQELDRQARDRRRLQQEQNALSPTTDDIYICPFCEFENISGYKPRFLIRSFEMKERKKRLEAERRQRLLDKAKARARKGRKPSKAGAPVKNGGPADSQPQDDALTGDGYEDDDGGDEGADFVFREQTGLEEGSGAGDRMGNATISTGGSTHASTDRSQQSALNS